MKVTGIIAEYNPFHNGHAYQIRKARELTGADYVIVVMSGNYVQRGAPAILDKFTRTAMALSGGADLVLELPAVFATSSAEMFAAAAIALLAHTGITDSVCFGCETPDSKMLSALAALLAEEPDAYTALLAEQLKEHSIKRIYHAIVHGNIKEDSGTVNAPIGRHPIDRKKMSINEKNGRNAVTHYRVLERFGEYTYIACELETGRTHQIRVHMASIHHPLLGDCVYGPAKCPWTLQGQTLHAKILGIIHPRTGKYMEFDAPLPEYFEKLLKKLRKMS